MKSDNKYPRTDLRYWREKVRKVGSSKGTLSPDFSIQIAFRGKRIHFPLETPNRDAAAKRAQKIYLHLLANGWEAALIEFKPESYKAPQSATVGEYIAEASAVADVDPRTLRDYATSFRKIVGEVTGNKRKSKEAPVRGKRIERVNAVPLEMITPEKVQAGKLNYVRHAGDDPVRQRSARNTADSVLRKAKALFGRKVRRYVSPSLVPDPLPFADVELFPRTSMRYVSKIDTKDLILKAREELGSPIREDETPVEFALRQQVYKAFLLALFTALRRKEIDSLLWRQIDLERGTISIEVTPFHSPKSEQSLGVLEIDSEIVELFRGFYAQATSDFVIESDCPHGPNSKYAHYRANLVFVELISWLRGYGIDDQKPIHTLRKEAGSIICENRGIFATSRFLRHADIHITTQHYVDKKERVTVGLGSLLSTPD